MLRSRTPQLMRSPGLAAIALGGRKHGKDSGTPIAKGPRNELFRPFGDMAPRRCRGYRGHPREGGHDGHHGEPEWERLPCPADAARPPGSTADHRRWGGNKPTSATGDPSWPVETAASRALDGDRSGREPWPRLERARRRLAAVFRTSKASRHHP